MAIGLVLKSLGYEVLGVARTAEAALEQIAATRPSFAIIDIHLPDRSGVELAASLLRNEDLPIIFLTGVDDPDMTLKGSNGVFGFLAKPASRTALRAMVELVRMQAEGRRRLQKLESHYHALFDQAAAAGTIASASSSQKNAAPRRLGRSNRAISSCASACASGSASSTTSSKRSIGRNVNRGRQPWLPRDVQIGSTSSS